MHATRSGFVTGMYSIALPCYLDLLNLQQCTRLHWVTVMQEGLAIEEECRKYHCNVISLENLLRDLLHLWKGVSYPSLVSDPVRVGQRSISRTMKWELRTFRMAVLRRRFTGKMGDSDGWYKYKRSVRREGKKCVETKWRSSSWLERGA